VILLAPFADVPKTTPVVHGFVGFWGWVEPQWHVVENRNSRHGQYRAEAGSANTVPSAAKPKAAEPSAAM
jgi:hypothetical protein